MSSYKRRREKSLIKLEKITSWLSSHYYELIADKAHENQIPMARQFQVLIDNAIEILGDKAFDVDTEFFGVIEEFEYADQAGKILRYMKELRNPLGIDSLMLTRHDIGIADKQEFLGGFAELLNSKLIKEAQPQWKENATPYEGYKVYKPVDDGSEKTYDKDAEIKKLKAKLKKLEKESES